MLEFLKFDYNFNIKKLYLASFFEALWFPLPIIIIFFLDSGLNLSEIGILTGAMMLTQFVFEIPTSIWADKYSRKWILAMAMLVSFAAEMIFFLKNDFLYFLLANILYGFSLALRSGTDSAITYDTLLNLEREKDYAKIQSTTQGIYFLGRMVVAIAGTFAYTLNHKLPFLLSAVASIITAGIFYLLKEPKYRKSVGTHFEQVKEGLKFLFSNDNIWRIIIIFSFISGASDVLFSFYQPVMNLAQVPVIYFSLVYLGVNIFSFAGSMTFSKFQNKSDFNKILVFYIISVIVVSFVFTSNVLPLILVAIFLLSFCFGSYYVYITCLINKIVPSSHRATAISIQSQMYLIIFSFFIIVAGKIASDYGIMWSMLVNAFVGIIALVAFLSAKINNKKLWI